MVEQTSISTVDEIIALYREYGSRDYIGESVTQVEHAIQATNAAKSDGYGPEEVWDALEYLRTVL